MAELQRRHQNSPLSTTNITPALPPSSSSSSSSSSSRTITPPGNARPPHRVSSSGTVQVVSPVATSVTAVSQTESSVWSPASRPSRIYGINSEIGSSTSIAGHNQYGQGQQQWQNQPYVMDSSTVDLPRHGQDERDCLLDYTTRGGDEVKMRRAVLHTVMHGVVLALQSGVSLGVLTFLVWMSLWKDDEGGLNGIPGGMLNNVPSLATTFVLILSSITLIVHEIYILSSVVLLYLQAAILALTTVSATAMWMNCVGEDDAMVKCVWISCSVFFLGTSGLAFLRAVVIWKVTGLDESEGLGQIRVDGEIQGENYATF
ncbi:hypothetical protein CI102_11281 [Trichoderma harzianum]|uniref:Uncharacterized protein n=1 Tax=Trichoderma harzianum CBS 226.95 TaxID=983964 RepID=A0A2T4AEZ5_TRIHA|nr:hypothetical protein M431DRAFT_84110 [Trichoderma harzianum CBS 226.95]PKK44255.1 hypothetical protein CI102_11281 [Trichoderma harzianum]PTB55498.1 hypothetical protein M431DRAFT_84110 [Trichoderma harzianum CBS 226.95]